MIRRPRRVIPASLVALVILAACVVTVISAVQELAGRPPLIPLAALGGHIRALRLDGSAMTGAGAVAAGLGLVLIACAVVPGRSFTLPLAALADEPAEGFPGDRLSAGVTRAGLRATLGVAVGDVDGVRSARIRVRGHRVTARVRTELDDAEPLRAAVGDTLEQRLSRAGLARYPDVRIRMRQDRGRGAA